MQVFSSNTSFKSNIDDVKEYTLGDPRVICRILSDNLYSNKIGSIVRELSANALDAHKMVGKENVPFDVVLPAQEGLFIAGQTPFSIRDYGPGLSESEIYSLYTSYGSSSKREDNGQIGGFGIGSKSPFAYTDAFSVTSWNGGLKSNYLCFLNKEGSPCIKKIFETKSEDPTGMQIDIPIKLEDDAERFRSECANQYSFYDIQPRGGLGVKPEVLYENDYGFIYSSSSCPRNGRNQWNLWRSNDVLYAKVNNYVYRLSWDDSRNDTQKYGMRNGHIGYNTLPFNGGICVLKIDGSLVDLSASREELAFTARTKEAINSIWESFICRAWKDIFEDIEEKGKESRFEAIWSWKERGLNFRSFKEWVGRLGKGVSWIDEMVEKLQSFSFNHYPMFWIDAREPLGGLLGNVLRGYEAIRSRSCNGNPTVVKMIKVSESQAKLAMKSVIDLTPTGEMRWSLDIDERDSFKLMLVNKDATYAAIKEHAKKVLKDMVNGILHIYATNDESLRKKLIAAYGNPSEKHLEIAVLKTPKKANASKIFEKKDLVKARCNFAGFGSNHISLGSADNVLLRIRSRLKEQWLSKEDIENHMENGAVVLVTNGIETSKAYNPSQYAILTVAGGICNYGSRVPDKWILLNEQSYQKLLSLGFVPLDVKYSRKVVDRMMASIGVEFDDFIKWLTIYMDDKAFDFDKLEDMYGFSRLIAPLHPDHPASKAILFWKNTKHVLECNMNRCSRLQEMMCHPVYGLYDKNERSVLESKAKDDLQWSKIEAWYKANPILSLHCHCYGNDKEQEGNAEILAKYLVWD